MTAKSIKFVIIFALLSISVLFSNPSYKMQICDIEALSSNKIQACVYIENVDEEFVLTSYQCALSINQSIDLSSLQLEYVEGSSDLLNEPNLFVGVDNIDGPTELTFVSYIGSDIISSKKLVGVFTLEGEININDINLLDIQWDFEGTISTIITGEDFVDITNPASHVSIFPNQEEPKEIAKVSITGSSASAITGEKYVDENLYDGITSLSNGGEYGPSDQGRWAVSGFPQWVTIDLGEETYVEQINLDPYGSDQGITYDCEFYNGDYENKELLFKESTQSGVYWSEHDLGGISTRYITILFTGSQGNDWCDIWEIEVLGYNSTTHVREVEQDNESEEIEIPSDYGISQNYPNPFNPSTKVEVMMKDRGNARLDVYNILGEKVIEVMNEELSAGVHQISIDGSRLASGLYIYQLIINNEFTQSKKMQLMK